MGFPFEAWFDEGVARRPGRRGEEALAALSDETAGTMLRERERLPEREKQFVLGIVRQFSSGPEADR